MVEVIGAGQYEHAQSIDLWEAQRLLTPEKGKAPNIQVIRRWTRQGRSVRGRTVVMPSVKWGNERRTMTAWVQWFLAECIRAEAPPQRPRGRTTRQAQAAHRRADERLRLAGM